jgi:hypothetical protein
VAQCAGWTPAAFLRYYAVGLAAMAAYFLVTYYIWPAHRADLTLASALGLALMTTVITYALHGVGPDLRSVTLDGVIWDETTRWPWRFQLPAHETD